MPPLPYFLRYKTTSIYTFFYLANTQLESKATNKQAKSFSLGRKRHPKDEYWIGEKQLLLTLGGQGLHGGGEGVRGALLCLCAYNVHLGSFVSSCLDLQVVDSSFFKVKKAGVSAWSDRNWRFNHPLVRFAYLTKMGNG